MAGLMEQPVITPGQVNRKDWTDHDDQFEMSQWKCNADLASVSAKTKDLPGQAKSSAP